MVRKSGRSGQNRLKSGLWKCCCRPLVSAGEPSSSCCVSFLLKFDWEQLLGLILGTLEPSDVFVFSRAACGLRNLSSVSC